MVQSVTLEFRKRKVTVRSWPDVVNFAHILNTLRVKFHRAIEEEQTVNAELKLTVSFFASLRVADGDQLRPESSYMGEESALLRSKNHREL